MLLKQIPMKTIKTIEFLISLVVIISLIFTGCEILEENYAPTASFTVSPDSGNTETIFVFDASSCADPEDDISNLQIRWDFNGDGVWETEWITDKIYNIQFQDESSYTAILEVKDTEGLTNQTNRTVYVSNGGGNTSPTAFFDVAPGSGTTNTIFAFDASGSTDTEDPTSDLQVRWDFDGDGNWDTNWDTSKTVNYQYSSEATFSAKMEVKDTKGLTDQYTKSITISNGGGSTGSFTDNRDGNTYSTIEIGNQTWMAENLAYLPTVSPKSEGSNSEPYFYVYGYEGTSVSLAKEEDNYTTYGVLYNWPASTADTYGNGQDICPGGWHLPSQVEWTQLTDYLINNGYGIQMDSWVAKSMASNSLWELDLDYNVGGDQASNNSSGFNALPGGERSWDGGVYNLSRHANFWSSYSSDPNGQFARMMQLKFNSPEAKEVGLNREDGFSVRCIKD